MHTLSNSSIENGFREQNFKELSLFFEKTRKDITRHLSGDIEGVIRFYDLHYAVIKIYAPILYIELGSSPSIQALTTSSLIGNAFTLHSALELTIKGRFSSAKTLFRKIFEFLMIGKYCGFTQKEKLAEEWLNGSNIDLYSLTMKHMVTPANVNIIKFWRVLCKYNHGTVYSTENNKNWKDTNEVAECLTFSFMLIACNNHLLKSVILKENTRAKYNAEYWRRPYITNLNRSYWEQYRLLKKQVGSGAISFIRDFSRKWEYKK